eukprot:TRINITY_DN4913_c0_g1_i1.p1 TRINITY_DN4913_c0_g1~~TRINITY_DN4913_c0_g1_i1.p1  ORF type:complete len:245 (+),score=96.18 TRINITY_DN4913_c0_g1_i1:80-814(+)
MPRGRIEGRIFSTRGLSYVVGGALIGYSGYCTSKFYNSKFWPRVDGRILGVYPYRAWLGDDAYRFKVDYEYEYDGKKHYSTQVETGSIWKWWMGDWFRDTIGTNEVKRGRFRTGGLVKVFVNPEAPNQCGLFRTNDATRNGVVMGSGATLIFAAWFLFPKNHRFDFVQKMRWFYKYRLMFNAKKTRVIDVVFSRNENHVPAYKQEGYVPNEAIRSKLGLDADLWDKDVQDKRKERLLKEEEGRR